MYVYECLYINIIYIYIYICMYVFCNVNIDTVNL